MLVKISIQARILSHGVIGAHGILRTELGCTLDGLTEGEGCIISVASSWCILVVVGVYLGGSGSRHDLLLCPQFAIGPHHFYVIVIIDAAWY